MLAPMTIGERLGPYRIVAHLGGGGMGEVYQAWDERLERWVAIKGSLHPPRDQAEQQRLRREAIAAARLRHPAVVQVYDLVETSGTTYIVMEHVEGETLRRRLAAGPPPLPDAVRWLAQVAEGLATAHTAGVVHRDLKSENILITAEGEARIIDFGLSFLSGSGRSGDRIGTRCAEQDRGPRMLGTCRILSPEQVRGETGDERSDLFSLGVLMYEVFTGRSPFATGDEHRTLRRILHAPPPALRRTAPELPTELATLTAHLLQKDPALRPRTVDEVARVLHSWLQTHGGGEHPTATVSLRDEGAPRSPLRFPMPHAPLILVTILLTLTAALAGLGWWRRDPPLIPETPGQSLAQQRIAVLPPVLHWRGDAPVDPLIRLSVQEGALQGIASHSRLAAVDPAQISTGATDAVTVAREVAADEVLRTEADCDLQGCRVVLRRVDSQGNLLWSGWTETPADDFQVVTTAVRARVQDAYPEAGRPSPILPEDEYLEYLWLRNSFESRALSLEVLIQRLGQQRERLRATVGWFPEGVLLEIDAARLLFFESHGRRWLLHARGLATQLHGALPHEARALKRLVDLDLLSQAPEEARRHLEALRTLYPGDASVLWLEARLAEARGDSATALSNMRQSVERRPSWQALFALSTLELRLGNPQAARRHLTALRQRAPQRLEGLQLLAQVELTHGDPQQATRLYRELLDTAPTFGTWLNFGFAHLLLANYPQAKKAFEQAVRLQPDHPAAVLNLADSDALLGRSRDAAAGYRRVVALLTSGEDPTRWEDWAILAQAHAHLGAREETLRALDQVLALAQDNPRAGFELALIYSLLGDRQKSATFIRRAQDGGLAAAWFDLPWFLES